MKNKIFLLALVVFTMALPARVISQNATYDSSVFIDIDINSGNPNSPFPQFMEYTGGKTLAKHNAEGVTHADMEKAMREAYEIMMHRCRYEGTYCGVKYISFNSDAVAGNYGTFVSEGDGYALLASAIFADQKTFNGLYMWIHDIRFSGVERFRDGGVRGTNSIDFAGPYLAAWKDSEFDAEYGADSHSATDGDVDIAMAMLIAYKQWGEWMMQDGQVVRDSRGNPISLKYEAQRVIGALVDTLGQWDKNGQLTGMLCGVIGIDGYEKRGNSWGELTQWRFSDDANARYPGVNGSNNEGPNLYSQYGGNYIDYDAPSYFEEFWRWLKNGDGVDDNNRSRSAWEIHQFKRAAASGNWLNEKAYDQGLYASIGRVEMATDGQPTFGVFVDGEDFRYPWRHILDYLWHGDADYDWDPVSHQVIEEQTNNSERLMGVRHAGLLKNPANEDAPLCSRMGASPDPAQPLWFGVAQIPQQWTHTGGITSAYRTNYSVGAGATAAVASEDLELIADIYRQCELKWDGTNTKVSYDSEERYMNSTPKYFHGWFRTLGMLVCSGNLIAPEQMTPKANMKVYMSVDKTYAYEGDKVGYTVQYRNYGSVNALDVTIQTPLDEDYTFVSATKGGVYDPATHTITWNIGTVPGFKSGELAATIDSVAFTVQITSKANDRVCETSTISGGNFPEWISNEYPNHATYTMERNCVDVLANRSLVVKKSANREEMNPNDKVTFTVDFENVTSEDSWLNGGRDNVRISYGMHVPSLAYQVYSLYRFWNDSYEAYINMSNYRVSYYLYDAKSEGLYDAATNPTGWMFVVDNPDDLDEYGYNPSSGPITFSYQKLPQGEDEYGKWNQRLTIRFADELMAPSTHIYDMQENLYQLHKGVWGPGLIRARLASNPASDLSTRILDDWSYSETVTESELDGQGATFTIITPCWANNEDLEYEIDNYARHTCSSVLTESFDRVLVEEFDGYTWRRIQGRGPCSGKDAYNVVIVDTIPKTLRFDGFETQKALGVEATYIEAPEGATYSGIVKWTYPEFHAGEKGTLVYSCIANDIDCPNAADAHYISGAWIYSDTDSPDSSAVSLTTTCTELPPYLEPQTSLIITASQENAVVGDVISYEVKYENTTGTIVDEDCSSTTNWMGLGGKSFPSTSGGALPLSTSGSNAYFFGPKYSYGKDGAVYLTFSGCSSTTQELYFVMRYKSGIPGASNFQGIAINLHINRDGQRNFGYELYDNGTMVAREGTSWSDVIQFTGSNTNPVFKFVLNGDQLYMYVNDQENEWINVLKSWNGLSAAGPGNFGLYVNSNGNGQTAIDNFRSELDYAYNVTLSDELPDELGDIKNITGNGTYSSGTKKITWPMVAGPIAPNTGFSYTFDATVDECNSYINNYAVASVYGLEPIRTVNSVKCVTTIIYDVVLNTNGGTINNGNVTEYTFGEGATLPTDVTMDGYTFLGWYEDEACETEQVLMISDEDFGNKTYYAKWSMQDAHVCFDLLNAATETNIGFAGAWDGCGAFSLEAFEDKPVYSWSNKGTAYGTLSTYGPEREQRMSNADLAEFQEYTSISELRLKGRVYLKENAGGDIGVWLNDMGDYNANYAAIPMGLTVGEWTEFDIKLSDVTTNYQTYNAGFTYTGAKIRYVDDGDNGSKKNYTIYIDYLQLCPPTPPAIVSCHGGTVTQDNTVSVTVDKNSTVYVVNKSESISAVEDILGLTSYYTINDCESGSASSVVIADMMSTFSIGDELVFYAVDENSNISEMSECSFIIQRGTYTVTLQTNEGAINAGNVTSYTYGTEITLPTNVTRDNYTFGGWYINSSFTGSAVTKISATEYGNKTFYAKWIAKSYDITLNSNGGTINSGNIAAYTYGVGATLPTNLTRTGYTFAGWYASSDFSGQEVTSISATAIGDTTLYAKWNGNLYAVTLNTNYGTINSGNITEYTYGVGATLPTDVTMDGYTFKGWYENSNLLGTKVTAISTTDIGSKEYWAKWAAATYTITFVTNGGTINSGKVTLYTYGSGAILPADVTKSGSEFLGWYEDEACETEPILMISDEDFGNKTYYAKWSAQAVHVHSYEMGEWTWSSDNKSATLTFVCSQNSEHMEIVPATVSIDTVEATCKLEGSITYTATVTFEESQYTDSKEVTLEKLNHTADTIYAIAPTCTTDGWTGGNVCSVCGDTIVKPEMVPATGHTSDTIYAIAPTCTTDGWTGGNVCSVCGDTLVKPEMISATGHTSDTIMPIAPTCTKEGWTGGNVCSVCGDTLVRPEMVPATVHTVDTIMPIAPTCTTEGWTGGNVCSVCGDTLVKPEMVPATGHTSDTIYAIAPTCTTEGRTGGNVCSVCGDTLVRPEMVPATGHTADTIMAIAPTCTNEGWTGGNVCSVCGDTLVKQEMISATGHTSDTIMPIAPTCTTDGWTGGNVCSVCGDTLVRPEMVPANGHHTLQYIAAVAPTKFAEGNTEYWQCTECGKLFDSESAEHEITMADVVLEKLTDGTEYDRCDVEVSAVVQNCSCFGVADGAIELEIDNVDDYYVSWSNGRSGSSAQELTAGMYYVSIIGNDDCQLDTSFVVTEPDEILVTETITHPSCNSSDGKIEVSTNATNPRYVWSDITFRNTLENAPAGEYELTVTSDNGCSVTKKYTLSNPGAPVIEIDTVLPARSRVHDGGIAINVTGGNGAFTYSWDNGSTTKNLGNLQAGDYTVQVTDENNCVAVQTITVPPVGFTNPEISLVTVDRLTQHNLVVWEREETDEIHHYNVYRESSRAFQYEKIGEVPYNDISVFEDEQADVKHQSTRYRIAAVDYDGNESVMSKEHKTMLLAQNAGLTKKTVNLIWDSYEGIDYTMFRIYRNTLFRGWELIDSVSSRSFIWIDDNVPLDILGYTVAIDLPREINPKIKWQKAESGPFNIAISNIAEVENETAVDDVVSNNVKVYPLAKQIIIENAEKQMVKVCDNTGRELYRKNALQICGQQLRVDVRTSGVYFVMIGTQAFTVVVE